MPHDLTVRILHSVPPPEAVLWSLVLSGKMKPADGSKAGRVRAAINAAGAAAQRRGVAGRYDFEKDAQHRSWLAASITDPAPTEESPRQEFWRWLGSLGGGSMIAWPRQKVHEM